MFTLVVVLSLLAGWLVKELKDFFSFGGISNILAFGLLKMIFITVMILIFATIIIGSQFLKELFSIKTPSSNNNELTPTPTTSCVPARTSSVRTSRIREYSLSE